MSDDTIDTFDIGKAPEEPLKCPVCGGPNVYSGYGFAAGGLGIYLDCEDCDKIVEFSPDSEGQIDEGEKPDNCNTPDDFHGDAE